MPGMGRAGGAGRPWVQARTREGISISLFPKHVRELRCTARASLFAYYSRAVVLITSSFACSPSAIGLFSSFGRLPRLAHCGRCWSGLSSPRSLRPPRNRSGHVSRRPSENMCFGVLECDLLRILSPHVQKSPCRASASVLAAHLGALRHTPRRLERTWSSRNAGL